MNRGDQSRAELLAQVKRQAGPRPVAEEITQSAHAKAQRIIGEELEALGWDARELAAHQKGDPEKLSVAIRLRREITMTVAWIAQHLCMGSAGYVNTSSIGKLFTKPIEMLPREARVRPKQSSIVLAGGIQVRCPS